MTEVFTADVKATVGCNGDGIGIGGEGDGVEKVNREILNLKKF